MCFTFDDSVTIAITGYLIERSEIEIFLTAHSERFVLCATIFVIKMLKICATDNSNLAIEWATAFQTADRYMFSALFKR